jgi:hypothetical protein
LAFTVRLGTPIICKRYDGTSRFAVTLTVTLETETLGVAMRLLAP